MSHLDDLIRSDLDSLGERSARSMPAFDDLSARLVTEAGPYRDERPGAEARRQSLLETRLRELAFTPMVCERLFVHRVSRAAGGAMALAALVVTVAASMDTWSARLVHAVIGVPTAPLVATLLAGSVLFAYVTAGLFAERYYERKLRQAVDTSGDPLADIDKLEAISPSAEARALLDRVDAISIALPLAGLVAGGLWLGLMLFFSDHGFSALELVAYSRGPLMLTAGAGAIAAFVLGSACKRERRGPDRPLLVRAGEHWATLVAGALLFIFGLAYASRTAFGLHAMGVIPDDVTAVALGATGMAALWVTGAWLLLWLRRREHHRLGE